MSEIGMKFDEGKAKISLIPGKALLLITKVLEFGAKKYKRNNWKKLNSLKDKTRLLDAMGRHYFAILEGELEDSEGLNHLACIACNAIFLMYHELSHKELDSIINGSLEETTPSVATAPPSAGRSLS